MSKWLPGVDNLGGDLAQLAVPRSRELSASNRGAMCANSSAGPAVPIQPWAGSHFRGDHPFDVEAPAPPGLPLNPRVDSEYHARSAGYQGKAGKRRAWVAADQSTSSRVASSCSFPC